MKQYTLGLVLAACSALSAAGTTTSHFFVKIEVRRSEKCVSETLSERTDALVQVVCRSGNFVSIEPRQGKPFLGTHGGAFRYFFSLGSGTVSEPPLDGDAVSDLYVGYGTVTGWRVVDATPGNGKQYEFLITY